MTRLLTNQRDDTLLAAIQSLIAELPQAAPGLAEAPASFSEIRIATGFVSPAGFAAVAPLLHQAESVRLMLGAEPQPEAQRALRRPGDPPPAAFHLREVAAGLRQLEAGLRRVRDRVAYAPEARAQLRGMARLLRSAKVETRRYERAYLHAKAMLLDGLDPRIIVGSSNLTGAGLTANLELNLHQQDHAVFTQARHWFDSLWDAAEPYDLAAIFEEPEQDFPPWLIFLRILWQLYGEELEQERREVGDIPLTAFQLHGVWRARRILKDFRGVIVADEVGLGKTFIGGAILEACARNRQRALLICPAALRRNWDTFLAAHNIGRYVELLSFDQLARDRQFHGPRRPDAVRQHLRSSLEEYALVVVDEAHNYRSPDTPYRGAVLRELLAGPRKDVVLLTATPVNNSLYDLYHLMHAFLRQDSALASRGVPKIRERFRAAAAQDPANLSPDLLYPIIDAVTVKRTRAFVKKYYAGDTIRGADGVLRPIVFPTAVAITLRYDLGALAPGLFEAVADALDPINGRNQIAFARYATGRYLLREEEAEVESAEAASGLIRSGLLKRFESSAHAFGLSLARMLREHALFLDALNRGKVIAPAFLREIAADEDAFDDLVESAEHVADAAEYDVVALRAAVQRDQAILQNLADRLAATRDAEDPKLAAVVAALAEIAAQARDDAATDSEEGRNRKVLLFSHFSDTVAWLRGALERHIIGDPRLHAYRQRIAAVAGHALENEDVGRMQAVWGFAPETTDPPAGQADLYDLLISTDVLAEGMNLQQARHIINYDLPWNPMRLVQRHGRIDRIGSPHPRVYLRTVFPADQLDALLTLETRILRKLAQAAKSIGVGTSPVQGAQHGAQVFAETRAEIERLARADPALFEQGGTAGAAQTGEEYRQRLRAALQVDRDSITALPGGAGSGLRRGAVSGVMLCAEVPLRDSRRTFLRFVPAKPQWQPDVTSIIREVGTCLRLVDCTADNPRAIPPALADGAFAFWNTARADILAEWDDLSDPANLQPPVRLLNRQVAAFMRAHPPAEMLAETLSRALDILESPWPRREEALLRGEFRTRDASPHARTRRLVPWILATGLEPFQPPAPLPPITPQDVRLVCWMAVEAA